MEAAGVETTGVLDVTEAGVSELFVELVAEILAALDSPGIG